jgi:hypothetical protein
MGLGMAVTGDGVARPQARRDAVARRSRLVASGMIVFPIISGLFFGILSAALVVPIGGVVHASEVAILVGGVMFTANAAALCIVQSSAWDEPERPAQPAAQRITEVRAS